MPFPRLHRLRPAPRHMRAAIGGFALLILISSLLYSGGNNIDPGAAHFHPVHNFLCDLFMPLSTHNGRPNTASATLGIAGGLLLLVGGFLPTWTTGAIRLSPRGTASRVTAASGVLAVCGVALVPLENVVVLPWPHYLTLLAAVVPAVFASSGVALLAFRHAEVARSARARDRRAGDGTAGLRVLSADRPVRRTDGTCGGAGAEAGFAGGARVVVDAGRQSGAKPVIAVPRRARVRQVAPTLPWGLWAHRRRCPTAQAGVRAPN